LVTGPESRITIRLALLAVGAGAAAVLFAWWSRESAREAHAARSAAYAPRLLERVGTLPDELSESSGVAASRAQPGVLWSHNDSGDEPRLYAIDESGGLLATVGVARASARDWEDLAAGPCPGAAGQAMPAIDGSCLYIFDIGDNAGLRDTVAVHVVVEPGLADLRGDRPVVTARSVRFRYPGGPDDSEAAAVEPNGDVTIVTKGRSGTIDFYRLSHERIAHALQSRSILTAERAGSAGIDPEPGIGRSVTGAAVSPDGATLAVRTYNEVFFYRAVRDEGGTRWSSTNRRCFLGFAEPLGEAIAYIDMDTLVLTSERGFGQPGPIHRLRC
jgi:hypothetical protein